MNNFMRVSFICILVSILVCHFMINLFYKEDKIINYNDLQKYFCIDQQTRDWSRLNDKLEIYNDLVSIYPKNKIFIHERNEILKKLEQSVIENVKSARSCENTGMDYFDWYNKNVKINR